VNLSFYVNFSQDKHCGLGSKEKRFAKKSPIYEIIALIQRNFGFVYQKSKLRIPRVSAKCSKMCHFHCAICLTALFSLFGCAENPREALPGSITQSVKESVTVVGQDFAWRGPTMQVRHYRTLFYGYDSVYYWLVARKSPKGGALYEMSIAADYGGDLRHYDAVKSADGSIRPMVNQQHDTERCQFFNSMVYSCLYHDRASLELSESELVAARFKGLRLTLSSGKQDYETIDLPANNIQGFLQAVQ